MGYGEFGGGGSVNWTISHGGGAGGGGNGHDSDVPRRDGQFVVKINTGNGPVTVIGPFDVQDDNPRQIQVIWRRRGGGGGGVTADQMINEELDAAKGRLRKSAEDLGK